jgi:hypothetical protein
MKESVFEFIIIFVASYLLFSFIMFSINPMEWGALVRLAFSIVTIATFVINKRMS